ncbi:MAG: saccharopine dehydrogenase NADP-binding domain-containing protein [Deltaproteobacteria bacterium]|nr:saccharopine dehydrogenase NADP-binding domain-containing protein [Deltaproteobacteria bacterium]
MDASEREFDVIVWGATGFTGRLVAEYLLGRYGVGGELRWAMAGRNSEKLAAVRADLGRDAGKDVDALPILTGDSADQGSLEALAAKTRVVCTTVGPYATYGSGLVEACAKLGTDYCDLAGEVQWMRRMIDAHEATATASGARIVHACGFDSIPSDLGTFFLQREMRARHGTPARHVKLRVKASQGGASGGTIASMLHMLDEVEKDPSIRGILADPYALNPADRRSGPDRNEALAPTKDDDFDGWVGMFVMAGINTRVVRLSNVLLGDLYGADFRYDEAILTGGGPLGYAKALGLGAGTGGVMALMSVGPIRRGLSRFLPKPGEGPSKAQREAGFFDLEFHGEHPDDRGKSLRARVTGDRDPGYGSTSKMLAEAAVCLAKDEPATGGGFWTPASAMSDALITRLVERAGLTFTIEGE